MYAEQLRKNAADCRTLASTATNHFERLKFSRLAVGWQEQADNQDWLDGTVPQAAPLHPVLDHAA